MKLMKFNVILLALLFAVPLFSQNNGTVGARVNPDSTISMWVVGVPQSPETSSMRPEWAAPGIGWDIYTGESLDVHGQDTAVLYMAPAMFVADSFYVMATTFRTVGNNLYHGPTNRVWLKAPAGLPDTITTTTIGDPVGPVDAGASYQWGGIATWGCTSTIVITQSGLPIVLMDNVPPGITEAPDIAGSYVIHVLMHCTGESFNIGVGP